MLYLLMQKPNCRFQGFCIEISDSLELIIGDQVIKCNSTDTAYRQGGLSEENITTNSNLLSKLISQLLTKLIILQQNQKIIKKGIQSNSFMSLVIMCGIPGSGKTKRAQQLKQELQTKFHKNVILINEESLKISKNVGYSSAQEEKILRAQIKFETEKNLVGDNIVIVDSLNYIKGYRYQMYCICRQMKSTYCVIFCNTSLEVARQFNAKNENRFSNELFDDLAKRLQVPQLKNRWDIPLFERRQQQETPVKQIIDVLLFQNKKSKDPISTKSEQKMVGEDYLYELDKIIQSICEQILKQQSEGNHSVIVFHGNKIILNNIWSIIALKKIKNEFLTMVKGKPVPLNQVASIFSVFVGQADKRK